MLSFSEWWQKQVNPAWRKLMEDSKQIEYFKKGYEAALAQMPTQSADELLEENKFLNEQLAQAQEELEQQKRQLRRLKELSTKMTLVLVESEESDNEHAS